MLGPTGVPGGTVHKQWAAGSRGSGEGGGGVGVGRWDLCLQLTKIWYIFYLLVTPDPSCLAVSLCSLENIFWRLCGVTGRGGEVPMGLCLFDSLIWAPGNSHYKADVGGWLPATVYFTIGPLLIQVDSVHPVCLLQKDDWSSTVWMSFDSGTDWM